MEEKAEFVQKLVSLSLLIKSARLKAGVTEFKLNISLNCINKKGERKLAEVLRKKELIWSIKVMALSFVAN